MEKALKLGHNGRTERRDEATYQPYRLNQRLDEATRAELVRSYKDGTPTTELTRTDGLSKAGVLQLLQQAGVYMRRQGLDDKQTAEAVRLYRSGLSLVRVGEQVGFGPTSVAHALRAAGVELRGRHEWRG